MGNTDYILAARNGDLAKVKKAIEVKKIDITAKTTLRASNGVIVTGTTALHEAAAEGHLDIVEYLLKKGFPINQLTQKKWTPLHAATFNKRVSVARYLVNHGANPFCKDANGHTPCDGAMFQGLNDLATSLQQLREHYVKKKLPNPYTDKKDISLNRHSHDQNTWDTEILKISTALKKSKKINSLSITGGFSAPISLKWLATILKENTILKCLTLCEMNFPPYSIKNNGTIETRSLFHDGVKFLSLEESHLRLLSDTISSTNGLHEFGLMYSILNKECYDLLVNIILKNKSLKIFDCIACTDVPKKDGVAKLVQAIKYNFTITSAIIGAIDHVPSPHAADLNLDYYSITSAPYQKLLEIYIKRNKELETAQTNEEHKSIIKKYTPELIDDNGEIVKYALTETLSDFSENYESDDETDSDLEQEPAAAVTSMKC